MSGIGTANAQGVSIYRQTVDLLLASMFKKAADGRIQKFMFGKPGAAQWEKRMGTELEYSRKGLLAAALFVRENGPKYITALPIGAIESRLMDFIAENYWYLANEAFLTKFDCSYGDVISEGPRIALTSAIEKSEIFCAPELLTIYPIVPLRVEADFDGGAYFLIAPLSLSGKLLLDTRQGLIVPTQFPPIADHKGLKESPSAWLGTRSPTSHGARKIKAAVLGALALTPHRMERYMFTGRKVFGGQCVIGDGYSFSFGGSHTPPLSENIVITADDHAWLNMLAEKFTSDTKVDRKHIKALEYYYRAWEPDSVARFSTLFMALDAIYGDASHATQSVIDAVGPVMGPEYTYDRLKRLLSLRAAVIHGGAPDVCESDNYHRYYVDYGDDPIRDLELIVARCFQAVIFRGLLKERPHTYADLIREKTGRIV